MSLETSVQEYVAMQPRFAWRRSILRTTARVVFRSFANISYTNTQNVPDTGPGILLMNHISLLDPILCLAAVTNRFVVPMSKIENASHPLIGPLIRMYGAYWVNRGEVDRKALINSIELLKSGTLILIAPEGTRQTNGLNRPKDGLAFVATKADAIIIPAAVSGAQNWEKQLSRFKRPTINVNFGRPFRFKLGDSNRARIPREELSAMTEEAMYQLALALPDENLRGLYRDVSQATTEYLEFIDPNDYRALPAS
jgi:1-acyl-sn-glycerol-3-phosphate acyltransferase